MTATPTLDRRVVVSRLLKDRGKGLVVSGLGSPTFDVFAVGDSPLNFYFWGGMGGTVMTGLGLALAQPARRVLVITGDGDLLMGLGSLATVGVQRPENLAVAVLDNQAYGETGNQPSHTGRGVDLLTIARGTGMAASAMVTTNEQLDSAASTLWTAPGPVFVTIKISSSRPPLKFPERDGTAIKHRFRQALLGHM